MESLRELYRIGAGPSSSHTMGPQRAARLFAERHPQADRFSVTLFGSLAATGRGHLTDVAVTAALAPRPVSFDWRPDVELPVHPNGLRLEAWAADGSLLERWETYSIGGGALYSPGDPPAQAVAPQHKLREILDWCTTQERHLHHFVWEVDPGVRDHLSACWQAMQEAIERGLAASGVLPGRLQLPRKAAAYHQRTTLLPLGRRASALLTTYALAVSEENAAAGIVVTAPTCGASGVLPAVLRYLAESQSLDDRLIVDALAVAGVIGMVARDNASISGAEVGCQGEVGVACAMAGAAACFLLGGSPAQCEYAAEMGIEHHLGLTCDPIAGLVQIPCIERNAGAASRALANAEFALLSDGRHRVSYDAVLAVMMTTGQAMSADLRETARGGLARLEPSPDHDA